MKLTLLGVPSDIRHHILGHVLTIDRSAEYLPDPAFPKVFDLRLLEVSHQIREEALKVLKISNLWINLTVVAAYLVDANPLLHKLIGQQAVWKLPLHTLFQNSEEPILNITVGTKWDIPEDYPTARPCPKPIASALFPYSKRTYAYLCQALWANKPWVEGLEIYINPRSIPTGLNVVDKFFRPMAMIRGLKQVGITTTSSDPLVEVIRRAMESPVTWTWREILSVQKSFSQRGYCALHKKDYLNGIYYYDLGTLVVTHLFDVATQEQTIKPIDPQFLESVGLASDLHSNYALAINKLVESRTGKDKNVTLVQLNIAVAQASLAFWFGMSDEQRCLAHYHRGIAIENRADYESLHGPTQEPEWPRVPPYNGSPLQFVGIEDVIHYKRADKNSVSLKPEYREAARDLRLALQLSRDETAIKHAVDRVDARLGRVTGQEDAPVVEFDLNGGRLWRGDTRLAERWALEHGLFVDVDYQRPRQPDHFTDYLVFE
jgi:hypothetical protein